MPKELVVNAWCDPCYEDGEHEPAEEIVVALGDLARMKPQVALLCERHRKEIYEPLHELMAAFGAVSGADVPRSSARSRPESRRQTPPVMCGIPGCDAGYLKNMGSFGSHVRQLHGMTVTEYREKYGEPIQVGGAGPSSASSDPELPIDEEPGPIGDSEATCEECGKVYSHALGNNRPTQALGVHLARVHGIRSPKRK